MVGATLNNVVKFGVENDVVSTLSNFVINIIDSTLPNVVNFKVDLCNVVSTLI